MSEELPREEIHDRLDALVRELLDEAGVQQPPVDALLLAQGYLRLEVPLDEAEDEQARQVAAAQTIARHLQPEALRRLGLDPTARRPLLGQSLVGMLADRLLLPTAWIREDGRALGWDLPGLRERYSNVSLTRLALRLLDLDDPCVITLLEDGRVTKRRSNAWRVSKRLSPIEQEIQRELTRRGRPVSRSAEGWRVQGWPLEDGDGSRAILRSVFEE